MSGVSSIEIILAANIERELPYGGTFFRCTEAEAAFTIKPDNDSTSDIEKGIGVTVRVPFQKLYIKSTVDQTIKLYVGSGGVDDSRFSLINPQSNTLAKGNSALVATTTTEILASDSNRLECLIQFSEDTYVGASGVTNTDGLLVLSGATFEYNNTAALYAYCVLGCTVRRFTGTKI